MPSTPRGTVLDGIAEENIRSITMNDLNHYSIRAPGMPREVEDLILNIIRISPQLSVMMVHTINKIAAVAFDAGVTVGLDNAIMRIEETNIKLQSWMN
jgi:hypothetical protein